MKKVLILTNHALGLHNFRKELLVRLIEDGYEVHVSLPNHKLVTQIAELGCHIHDSKLKRRSINLLEDIKLLFEYIKLTRKLKPDAIITYTIKPNVYGGIVARLFRKPHIANITGLGSTFQRRGSFLYKVAKFLYSRSLKKSDFVFFQNENNREVFLSEKIVISDQAVLVNGSGVNVDEFNYIERSYVGSIRCLFISRLMKEKGINEFLDAVELVGDNNGRITYGLLGFFEEKAIEERVISLVDKGLIQYLGVSYDMKKIYKNADLVVLPSYHEGMSNVLQEAAATGLPTITTDINGCKEIVDHQITGYLCRVKDSEDLADKIKMFIRLLPEDMIELGKNAREKMVSEFNRKHIIDVYMDKIKEISK